MTMVQIPASSVVTSMAMRRFLCRLACADEVAGDDHAVDLGGSFTDPLDAQLTIPALERHLARHAHAAEDLDAAVDHATGRLGAVHLADRRLVLDVDAAVRLPRRVV